MASKNIRGITIEIGGETTKLEKALKGVDGSLKNTQSSLKDVNKLLKLDPSNVNMLTQKQELLTKAVDDTKARLSTLKDAYAQLEQQVSSGQLEGKELEEAKERMAGLEREIQSTENSLEGYEKALKKCNPQLEAFGAKAGEVGEKLTKAGETMSKVSAGIVAVGAAGVKAAMDLDEGYDTIIAKTGATGEALEGLEGIANNIFKSMPVEMADVGAAVGEVNTRFGLTGDKLQEVSGQFLKFAELNQTDVSSSIDLVQKAMDAFGVHSNGTSLVLDTFNKVGQDTGISMDALSSTLVTNAGALQEMGLSISSAAALLGNLEKSGVDTSVVMTGLKKAYQNATKDGKTLGDSLTELQTNMEGADSETKAMQYAIDLFGAKAGVALGSAIKNGTINLQDLTDATTHLDDATGNLSQTYEATLDPWDKAKVAMNNLKLAGSDLGGALLEKVTPAIDKVIEIVEKVTTWFQNLDDKWKTVIVTVGAVVAAIGPVLLVLGKVFTAVQTLIPIITAVAGVLSGPVVLAVGAAVAAGALIIANWDKIKAKALELKNMVVQKFNEIKTGIGNAISAAHSTVTEKFNAIKSTVTNTINSMKTTVQNGLNAIKGFFSNLKLSLPKIKLPHFKINGKLSLDPPSVPKLSIDWYKKAMDNGMIMNSPTIFGMNGKGQLMAGGEAGSETIVGTKSLMGMIQNAVNNTASPSVNINVYGTNGQNVQELANEVEQRITNRLGRKVAAYA